MGMQSSAAMEKRWGCSKKIKSRATIWSRNPTSGSLSRKVEIRVSKRYLQTYAHCSIIHNNQVVGTTEVSIDGWMEKENKVHTYSGTASIHKMEWNPAM